MTKASRCGIREPASEPKGGCRYASRRYLTCGALLIRFLSRLKRRPGPRFHIAQKRLLPGELGMMIKKIRSQKIRTARVPGARDHAHIRGEFAVGSFSLDRATGIICVPTPFLHAAS